jgi:hypothetical protein
MWQEKYIGLKDDGGIGIHRRGVKASVQVVSRDKIMIVP